MIRPGKIDFAVSRAAGNNIRFQKGHFFLETRFAKLLVNLSCVAIVSLVVTLLPASANAQVIWDGGPTPPSGDGNFFTGVNWTGDVTPTSAQDVRIALNNAVVNINSFTGTPYQDLQLANTGSAITSTLNINSSTISAYPNSEQIATPRVRQEGTSFFSLHGGVYALRLDR